MWTLTLCDHVGPCRNCYSVYPAFTWKVLMVFARIVGCTDLLLLLSNVGEWRNSVRLLSVVALKCEPSTDSTSFPRYVGQVLSCCVVNVGSSISLVPGRSCNI